MSNCYANLIERYMINIMKFTHSTQTTAKALVLSFLISFAFSAHVSAEADITLNLKNADLQSFIETVAEITGKNFIVDPRVKAKVTVISARPMDKDEIYDVFLSVLQVHGFATVQVGNIVKILPDVNAKQGAGNVATATVEGDELVTRVIEVENVPAAQLVPILRPLVPQQGHLAAYPESNMLVISDRGANITRLEKIIKKIDQPDSQEIEVIHLEHASATEVVQILNSLRQAGGQAAQGPGAPTLAADERTNSILISGDNAAKVRIRGLIAHLDTPIEGTGNTQVVYLHYAVADEIAPILQGISDFESEQQEGGGNANAGRDEINIQADSTNNALIITAPPAQFESLRKVISKLDLRRAQVLVETVIAEVSTDLSRSLGAEGFIVPTGDDDGPAISSINTGNILNVIQDPFSVAAGLSLGAADLNGNTQWGFLIEALEGDASTNILSTPTLVTLDNEEAEIVVAQNVPFITGEVTNDGNNSTNPFQTIERQDVGITLRITPQINEGDSVRLQIEQEASTISDSAIASDIITNDRRIATSVMVDNDDILVLGGLTLDQYRDSVTKVPLFGDIPVVGNLFKNTTTSKSKQNLMIFIHPVILRNRASANLMTGSKYDFIRERHVETEFEDRGLIRENYTPFPDLNDLVTQLPNSVEKNSTPNSNDAFVPQSPTSSNR